MAAGVATGLGAEVVASPLGFFLAFAILSLFATLYSRELFAILSLFAFLYCRWYSLTLALYFSL